MVMNWLKLAGGAFGGLFLGWNVGANDAANIFGGAVASQMLRFRTAAWLMAAAIVIGAVVQGGAGIETVGALSVQTRLAATVCTVTAAVVVMLMSMLKVPVSTSQLLISAVVGVALARGELDLAPLTKVLISWLASPFAAMIVAILGYRLGAAAIRRWRPSVFTLDPLLRMGLVGCGIYGAYALGANAVAIVCAVFVGDEPWMLSPEAGALLGGLSIAVGAVTYSRNVMETVGKGIVELDAFGALAAVLGMSAAVHGCALIGVPVSTSQAIIGALIGVGLCKGLQVVKVKPLLKVCAWWLVSPVITGLIAATVFLLLNR